MQGMGGTGGMEGLLGGEVAPTAEQMMAMIEQLQAAGHNLEDISPDLAELMKNVKRDKGEMADPDLASESIEPEPGFVVKTVDTNTGTKVFINVCCHDKVPAPGTGWSSGMVPEEVQNALARRDEAAGGSSAEADAESLRFPLSAGQPKVDIDKKGERCVTFDCILNTEIVRQASAHRPLKAFLVELCIAWVAQKSKMALDEKFKLPKMRYKGEVIEKQNIRVDRKPLVCEVKDLPDEPSFPLVTKKLDKEKIKAKAKAKEEAARKQASASGAGSAPAGKAKPPTSNAAPPPGSSGFNFSGKQVMRHEVEYVGRPVTEVFVTVSVPPPQPSSEDATSTAQDGGSSSSECPVGVELVGRVVHVSCAGCYDLTVELPFAVSTTAPGSQPGEGSGTAAVYDAAAGQLRLRLRYAGLPALLAAARDEKPLPFGQLGLSTGGLLDLE